MCLGNIDNDPDGQGNFVQDRHFFLIWYKPGFARDIQPLSSFPSKIAKIITGGYQGFLRIYYPRKKEFHPEDLLLEQNLGAPILQVETGRFVR